MPTWLSMQPFPSNLVLSTPFSLNKDEFVVATSSRIGSIDNGIYVYNKKKNKWTKIMNYPQNELVIHASTLNKQDKVLYVYAMLHSSVFEFDLKTQSLKIKYTNASAIDWGSYSQFLFFQNELHIVGHCGSLVCTHSIYKTNENKLQTLHTFPIGFFGHKMVKLKSQELLLFGGISGTTYLNHIYRYCTDKTWHRLNIEMTIPLAYFGIVVTRNDDFVIILGGRSHDLPIDDIFVYDIKKNRFHQTDVKCPCKEWLTAVITNDKSYDGLLTFAYIHDCFKLSSFNNLQAMPIYLIQLVSEWVCNEEINLLVSGKRSHWAMNVDDIIQSIL
eukprot:75667_1